MRTTLLVHLSSAQPRENETDGRDRVTAMKADEPDDLDDDEDDDDFPDDEEGGGDGDDNEDDDSEDEEDDDEPETWQVVDFPAANCLDWPDFPAQLGLDQLSRSCVARLVSPRRRP
jgi:hypothetical protein